MDADGERSAPGGGWFDGTDVDMAAPPAPLCLHCGHAACPCVLRGARAPHAADDCPSMACRFDTDDFELWISQCSALVKLRTDVLIACDVGPFMPPEVRTERYDVIECCELCGEECNDGIDMHGGLWRMCPESDGDSTEGHTSLLLSGGWPL